MGRGPWLAEIHGAAKSQTQLNTSLPNIGYIPRVVQYVPVDYFMHDSLYLLIPYPYHAPCPTSPLVTTSWFSISVSLNT